MDLGFQKGLISDRKALLWRFTHFTLAHYPQCRATTCLAVRWDLTCGALVLQSVRLSHLHHLLKHFSFRTAGCRTAVVHSGTLSPALQSEEARPGDTRRLRRLSVRFHADRKAENARNSPDSFGNISPLFVCADNDSLLKCTFA